MMEGNEVRLEHPLDGQLGGVLIDGELIGRGEGLQQAEPHSRGIGRVGLICRGYLNEYLELANR